MKNILLIFDLDETLIHASRTELHRKADYFIEGFHVYKRPFLGEFLEQCLNKYRIAIWSSAEDNYVRAVVQKTLPFNQLEFVWARSNCSVKVVKKPLLEGFEGGGYYKEHQWIKPLRKVKIKGVGIKSMLIIDNSPYKVIDSRENALIVPSYEGDDTDTTLEQLLNFLEIFEEVKDVRKVKKDQWGINP